MQCLGYAERRSVAEASHPLMPFSPFYPYNDKHIGVLTQKGAATCVFRVLKRS